VTEALHCYKCEKPIGAKRCHLVMKRAAVVICSECTWPGTRELHAEFFPDCPHSWHDLYDHCDEHIMATNRRIAILVLRQAWIDNGWCQETGGSIVAADLVADRKCSGTCLVAPPEGRCECACHGVYHGALAGAVVTSADAQEDETSAVGAPLDEAVGPTTYNSH
jgi:hypothetical protein